MNILKVKTLLLLVVLSTPSIHAQFKLTALEMEEDFQVFQSSIQDLHPGLYWYYDSVEITSRFNSIHSQLDKSLELRDFYTLLQGFYANLGCGHSWMSMPFKWREYLNKEPYRMPFDLYFESERAFISRDYTQEKELQGLELLAINGEKVSDILIKLMHYAPSDGYNQTRRKSTIASNFSRYYQTMVRTDSIFNLRFQEGERVFNMKVSGIVKEEADNKKTERYAKANSKEKLLTYTTLEGVGYLKIKTFSSDWIKSQKQNYPKFLKETFRKLKEEKTRSLILDLRGNGGGDDDYGSLLCQYLISNEFKYFDRMEAVTKRFDYKQYSNTRSLNLLAAFALRKDKTKDELYTYNKAKGLKIQKPKSDVFEGPIFILTDGGTFSTSADVAAILHANSRGTFMGEEVGGGYYGNNSAIMYDVKLPNSKITYYIPIIRYYSAVDYPSYFGYGVKPDIAITSTYENYVSGTDEVLTKALTQAKE